MSRARRTFIVVGGGISGLATAHALHRQGATVTLVEARRRVGGNILTETVDGFTIDAGPDAFVRTKPEGTMLCETLGLGAELMTTQSRRVFVAQRDGLTEMPAGMALAVPTRLGPMLETPLLSFAGKLRMLGDLLLPGRPATEDESIGAFIERRFGAEAAHNLAAPLLGGIYAGDIYELSLASTFPQLATLEKEHGSLIRGFFAAQQKRRGLPVPRSRWATLCAMVAASAKPKAGAPSPFHSLKPGMQRLVESLASSLPSSSILLGREAVQLRFEPAQRQWSLQLDDGERLFADGVSLCLPAHGAAKLVPSERAAARLREIPYVSTATVFLGFERDAVAHPLDGVGFIAPKGTGRLMAATWVSSKWAHRSAEGRVLMRGFVGGSRGGALVDRSSDAELVRLVLEDMRFWMGRMGTPLLARVYRYSRANPQPLVGHGERVRAIREALTGFEGLQLAGAAYGSVGIPDCIRQGQQAAQALLAE